jgi:putative endopeptidase
MNSIQTRLALVAFTLFTAVVVPRLPADDRKAKAAGAPAGHEGFDPSVRPQDDFFRHVNGGWIARTEIPADKPAFGSFYELRDKSESNLRAIIEQAAADRRNPPGSEARKIGDLYKSFMDEARVEELGKKPIEADLARVDAIADKAALIPTIASLQREGVTGLFMGFVASDFKKSDQYILYMNQSGLSLPDEAYYRDDRFKPLREKFVAHVEKMFELAGIPDPKAEAAKVMAVETALAKHHLDRVKNRDRTLTYNKMDRKALESLSPGRRLDRAPARLLESAQHHPRRNSASALEGVAQVAGLARRSTAAQQAVRAGGL